MNGQIPTVMEKQAGFGESINILSNKISVLMCLISESKSSAQAEWRYFKAPSPIAEFISLHSISLGESCSKPSGQYIGWRKIQQEEAQTFLVN